MDAEVAFESADDAVDFLAEEVGAEPFVAPCNRRAVIDPAAGVDDGRSTLQRVAPRNKRQSDAQLLPDVDGEVAGCDHLLLFFVKLNAYELKRGRFEDA